MFIFDIISDGFIDYVMCVSLKWYLYLALDFERQTNSLNNSVK